MKFKEYMIKIEEISTAPLRSKVIGNRGSVITVTEVDALYKIINIVNEFDPEMIIELGTSWGGMTYLFNMIKPDIPLYTFDIKCPRKPDKSLFNKNVHFIYEDIVGGRQNLKKKTEKLDFLELSQELILLCNDPKKKLLYCDNGHKIYEVLYYAPQLNEGDMLGIHDWNMEISDEWNNIKNNNQRCTYEEFLELQKVFDCFENKQQFVRSWFGIKNMEQ